MNRYWSLLSKARRFHNRYYIGWCNVIAHCQGRSRGEVVFCLRQYSSVGVNRVQVSTNDVYSDGMYEIPRDRIEFRNPVDSSNSGNANSMQQNVGRFHHQPSQTSHYTTNEWTSPQNVGRRTAENIEVIQHHTGYAGKAVTFQQMSNHQNVSTGQHQQIPSNMYMGNEVAYPPGRSNQYSSVGDNMAQASTKNVYSDGMYKIPQNRNEFHKPGYSSPVAGNSNYRQNVGHFQHQSGQTSHYPTNEGTSPQNFGHRTAEKIEVNQQHTGYSNGEEAAAFQQMSNHQNVSTGQRPQIPSNMYTGNGVAYPPGGYRQEHANPSSNQIPYHQTNAGGYHNTHLGAQQQNYNGSHNLNIISQQLVSAMPHEQSAKSNEFGFDKDAEGTLEELDAFCKEWDLERAVDTMSKLSKRGVIIDMPRYLVLIDACGKAKALKEGQDVHQNLVKFASPLNINIYNRILEMYGKCGSMDEAYNTFNDMPVRNLTSWDTMITWFAKNGRGEDAIDMFTKFKEAGLKPDGQMFLGIFDACGVVNDVTEGLLHFDSMTKIYGITPTMAHYASIVHMFGSAGNLDGALEFIEKMPEEPTIDVWESLMNIARVQGNTEIGDHCAEIVEQLDPGRMSKEMKDGLLPVNDSDTPKKKVKKYNPLAHTKHEYRAGDQSHPENDKIYTVLRGLKETVKEAGYVAETKFVLHDIDPESKEEAIMAHSERLACTYALLTNPARMPLRIIKNLRVCGDCHNYFKIISKLVGREIIMRDAKRFHHFKDGKCSCNDYW